MNLSDQIVFDRIPKKDFEEFLNDLKAFDLPVYKEEGADGFFDLYNYWNERGYRRFSEKLLKNKFRVEEAKK